MPTKSLETLKQHGIKGANLGCPCPTCREAKQICDRRSGVTRRRKVAEERGVSLVRCHGCDELFMPNGLRTHEYHCLG